MATLRPAEGADHVGRGFSVDARRLGEGSGDITGLLHRCEAIASDAIQAITAMSGMTGHAGLASALGDAAGQGSRTFLDMGDAYGHVAAGLTTTAGTYARTEQELVRRSEQAARGLP